MQRYPEFARLLNQYLEANARSGSWLAGQLQVHQSTVNRWLSEHTRPRNPDIVIEITRIFDIRDAEKINELLVTAGYKQVALIAASHDPADLASVDDAIGQDVIFGAAGHIADAQLKNVVEEPPFMGLQFFDENDAHLFFGRDALTTKLVDQLRDSRFLAVLGASGSGKSSIVRAGMIPILRSGEVLDGSTHSPIDSQDWAFHVITPTAHPIKELAATLTRDSLSLQATSVLIDDLFSDNRSLDLAVHRLLNQSPETHLLLVVDQFEELFTLCRDTDERRAFVENLLTASVRSPDGQVTLIIALRADFYAYCAEFDDLREVLPQHQAFIGTMSTIELRQAIEEPANQKGLQFEPGLVDLLLQDIGAEPGALPLLSHTLLEIWKRREGTSLTLHGYTDAGRIAGAIAHTAETVLRQLSAEKQAIARNVFLRLTEFGDGSQDTRRRVQLEELIANPDQQAAVENVLTTLADARLITVSHSEIEVSHEALIREWPTLRQWLDEDREALLIHRRLTESAQEWGRLARDTGLLYRGLRLAQTLEWTEAQNRKLTILEREFLSASVTERDRRQEEREHLQREKEQAQENQLVEARKARNRSLIALITSTALLVIAVTFGLYLYSAFQKQTNELKVRDAIEQARQSKDALQLQLAIDKYKAAESLDQELDTGMQINLASEITETIRYILPQLVAKAQRRELNGTPAEIVDSIVSVDNIAQSYGVQLGLDVNEEVANTLRVLIPPMVREGEALVKAERIQEAEAMFAEVNALDPPANVPHYIKIPAGTFIMGPDGFEQEIELDEFWILSTEVTNALYKECVEDANISEVERCKPPSNDQWDKETMANFPVINVTWHQAQKYATYVGGKLPTEAQWEKACRGTDGWTYPWGNGEAAIDLLNYRPSPGESTTIVGTYPSGIYGLYDMVGNVWEWTADVWERGRGDRTLRGGSFWNGPSGVRCVTRDWNSPAKSGSGDGFRVVVLGG